MNNATPAQVIEKKIRQLESLRASELADFIMHMESLAKQAASRAQQSEAGGQPFGAWDVTSTAAAIDKCHGRIAAFNERILMLRCVLDDIEHFVGKGS